MHLVAVYGLMVKGHVEGMIRGLFFWRSVGFFQSTRDKVQAME